MAIRLPAFSPSFRGGGVFGAPSFEDGFLLPAAGGEGGGPLGGASGVVGGGVFDEAGDAGVAGVGAGGRVAGYSEVWTGSLRIQSSVKVLTASLRAELLPSPQGDLEKRPTGFGAGRVGAGFGQTGVASADWFTHGRRRRTPKKLKGTLLAAKAGEFLALLETDPFANPPPFEALVGDLKGAHSRRINIQRRIVHQVLAEERIVKVPRLWTHCE